MILVTGSAGFIGHSLVNVLVRAGEDVIGIDNLNDYYDPALKWSRLAEAGITKSTVENNGEAISARFSNYHFRQLALEDKAGMERLFEDFAITKVCNLAAQAGVRYSLTNPQAYVESNVTGFVNVLENCRVKGVEHLVYASSSSVYGLNDKVPFAETDPVEQPASLYAATKRSNELMAHTYGHLYGLPTTGLRFFTVYGPWGRPDMAYSLFSDAILNGRAIKVFNHGEMSRDFTYGIAYTISVTANPSAYLVSLKRWKNTSEWWPKKNTSACNRAMWKRLLLTQLRLNETMTIEQELR